MRLEQLEYLVAISKSTSLNEASKRLYVSQQSLGKAITNLEDELHATLVIRTHNGCRLTKEGLEVLENAKDILRQVNEMKRRYNVCEEEEGDVVVICCPSIHETILPDVIDVFSAQLPHIKVTTVRKDSLLAPDLHKRLEACGNETVISILAVPAASIPLKERIAETHLDFQPIIDDYWVACMNKRNRFAHKASLSLKELLTEPLVIEYPDYPDYGIDRSVLEQYSDTDEIHIQKVVDNEHLMYSAISSNQYLGFASYFFITHSKHLHRYPDVTYRVFSPTIYAKIGMLYSHEQADNTLVRTFANCLEETVQTTQRNAINPSVVEHHSNEAENQTFEESFFALPLKA